MTTKDIAPPVDLPREQRLIRMRGMLAALVCAPTLLVASLLVPDWLSLPTTSDGRLALVLRADIFVALWVVIAVRMVSRVRFREAADNAGSAYGTPSTRIRVPSAFLQNSLEQAFIAIVCHLALATLPGPAPLGFVLGAIVLFALGRMTFLIGYPKGAGGRAFGMVVTVLPTIAGFMWVIIAIVGDLARAVGVGV